MILEECILVRERRIWKGSGRREKVSNASDDDEDKSLSELTLVFRKGL